MLENDTPTPDYVADPLDYDVERARLARRRKIAESLIATPIEGEMVGSPGGVRFASGPNFGAFLSRGAGQVDANRLDDQEKLLGRREMGQRDEFMAGIPTSDGTAEGDKARLAYLGKGMAVPSIRKMVEAQLGQEFDVPNQRVAAEAKRKFDAEQKELDRIEKGEQAAAERVAREDLRRIPAQSIHVSVGGGANGKAPSGYRWTADGELEAIKGGPADKVKALPATAQKHQAAIMNLESGLEAYKDILKDYDPQSSSAVTPAKRAQIGTAFTDMQMRLKEAYELGAITGPDMRILESALSDPTSIAGTLKGAAFGRDTFNAQAKEVGNVLGRLKGNFESQYGVSVPASARTPKADNLTVVRTGTRDGVKVQQMSDGSIREVK